MNNVRESLKELRDYLALYYFSVEIFGEEDTTGYIEIRLDEIFYFYVINYSHENIIRLKLLKEGLSYSLFTCDCLGNIKDIKYVESFGLQMTYKILNLKEQIKDFYTPNSIRFIRSLAR